MTRRRAHNASSCTVEYGTCTHGQHCWNGPARSLTVTMRCGGADAVLKVEEPEVCVYAMDMESPAACTDDDLRRAKDDLALFGA